MKTEQLPDGDLGRIQKKKIRQYLKNAAVAAGCIAAASLVLLYGRVSFFTGPAPRDDVTPREIQAPAQEQLQQQAPLRDQFKQRMSLYKRRYETQIAALNLSGWAPREQPALEAGEHDAVAAFAGGDFAAALDKVNGLINRVSALQQQHGEGFDSAVRQARQGLEAGDFESAQAAIKQAFLYRPGAPGAVKLKDRIDVMRNVAALVDAADVARAEGRLTGEISLLSDAIELDPARSDLVERRRSLIAEQQALDFDGLIKAGWTALERHNAGQAVDSRDKAARIFPEREELALLSAAIDKFNRERSYRSLIAKAQNARANDNWPSAAAYYAQALAIFPHLEQVANNLDLAQRITDQTRRLENVVRQPQRLSDARVSGSAAQLVEESRPLAEHSQKLRRLAARLTDAIRQASTPVPVVVRSDNKTHVSVLGIGVIGKVLEYHLKDGLKPGSYLFKGERRGFKDKLVQVQVRPGEAVSVTVICDEAI